MPRTPTAARSLVPLRCAVFFAALRLDWPSGFGRRLAGLRSDKDDFICNPPRT
jgi:hypothetical protein